MINYKTRLEKNASHGAQHEKHFQHADLHYNYGVGTFLNRIEEVSKVIRELSLDGVLGHMNVGGITLGVQSVVASHGRTCHEKSVTVTHLLSIQQHKFLCMREKTCNAEIPRENTYETKLPCISGMTELVCLAWPATQCVTVTLLLFFSA